MLSYIVQTSALGMGLAFLWHFSNIVRYGSHMIQEPNKLVLWLEISFVSCLVVLALIILISTIVRSLKSKSSASKINT